MRIKNPFTKPIAKSEPVSHALDDLKKLYGTESTSPDTMEFVPILLDSRKPTERSRKVLRATAVQNPHKAEDCLKIRLVYQKKHNKGAVPEGREFENLTRVKLSELPAGTEVQVDLDSAQTALLAEHIHNLYAIAAEGIARGRSEKVVVSTGDADFLRDLEGAIKASPERSNQILAMVKGLDPDVSK